MSVLEKLCRFGRCSYLYSGVVDDVALAPAAIEEQHQSISLFAERQGGTFKTQSMMASNKSAQIRAEARRRNLFRGKFFGVLAGVRQDAIASSQNGKSPGATQISLTCDCKGEKPKLFEFGHSRAIEPKTIFLQLP